MTDQTTPAGPLDTAHWQVLLDESAARHGVPGASLGILHGETVTEAVTGFANLDARIEATTDTLFQIGSITKVWTATVAMGLVDEGVLSLDEPVVKVLPELRLIDDDLTRSVTLRHLLSHTSGIDGDFFVDTGRGDDCLEKYTERLAEVGVNHPLGATMSYCNSGFNLIGRIIERLTGERWDDAMRKRLYEPLGLTHTVTLPEDALRFRTAIGHTGRGDDRTVVPQWGIVRSAGPAGLICSTPREVLTFARLHLNDGVTADGTRVLSTAGARLMREKQIDLPNGHTLGDSWGLGWILMGWDGQRLYGHDGATLGQSAFLRVLPHAGLAVCLLTNGGDSKALYTDLYGEIVEALAGVRVPTPLEPSGGPLPADAEDHLGVYEREAVRVEVLGHDGALTMRTTITNGITTGRQETSAIESELRPVEGNVYATRFPGLRDWTPVTFYRLADGSPYLHSGVRATPKVS
ncbi:serine hydrolase domain-containing protein [Embleya scabrispora]|uniref:serine hydrolase domain-containing protein n=1 Tax=Embleya scabrispora TaxID=159449 RepID=UPI00039E5D08|nr:serine hydrolase domain-containing protein [Embleya scabrispora]MYS86726.1 serine hydrolase [Streptomyces sp. SID5474]